MLTENANVVAIESDGLWVETLKLSTCNACSAKSGCGQHVLARYVGDMSCIKAVFEKGVSDRIWKVGDDVLIGIDEKALVLNALLVYMLPLFSMLSFAALFHVLGFSDLSVAGAAIVGLIGGGFLVKRNRMLIKHRSDEGKTYSLEVVVLEEDLEVYK